MAVMVCHSRASRALAKSFFVLTADVVAIGAAADSTNVFIPTSSHRCGRHGLMQVKVLKFFQGPRKVRMIDLGQNILVVAVAVYSGNRRLFYEPRT